MLGTELDGEVDVLLGAVEVEAPDRRVPVGEAHCDDDRRRDGQADLGDVARHRRPLLGRQVERVGEHVDGVEAELLHLLQSGPPLYGTRTRPS